MPQYHIMQIIPGSPLLYTSLRHRGESGNNTLHSM